MYNEYLQKIEEYLKSLNLEPGSDMLGNWFYKDYCICLLGGILFGSEDKQVSVIYGYVWDEKAHFINYKYRSGNGSQFMEFNVTDEDTYKHAISLIDKTLQELKDALVKCNLYNKKKMLKYKKEKLLGDFQ